LNLQAIVLFGIQKDVNLNVAVAQLRPRFPTFFKKQKLKIKTRFACRNFASYRNVSYNNLKLHFDQ